MIEKRRRDRINNSLNELRRLVPAAFEKQGSAKLEKAEILQMTVDHLTMLHAKGKGDKEMTFLRESLCDGKGDFSVRGKAKPVISLHDHLVIIGNQNASLAKK